MQHNDKINKKIIFLHNNQFHNIEYNKNNKDDVIYALPYIKNMQIGEQLTVKLYYDSEFGFINKDLKVTCCANDIKGKKVTSFKFKRRQNYSRKVGFSQMFTLVKVGGL